MARRISVRRAQAQHSSRAQHDASADEINDSEPKVEVEADVLPHGSGMFGTIVDDSDDEEEQSKEEAAEPEPDQQNAILRQLHEERMKRAAAKAEPSKIGRAHV